MTQNALNNEKALLQKVARGDHQAFRILFDYYFRPLQNPNIDKLTRLHLEDLDARISAKFVAEKKG